MLEMIVLGQIPGTKFQITIAWFLAMVFIGLLWIDHSTKNKIALQNLGKTSPKQAKLIRRKA